MKYALALLFVLCCSPAWAWLEGWTVYWVNNHGSWGPGLETDEKGNTKITVYLNRSGCEAAIKDNNTGGTGHMICVRQSSWGLYFWDYKLEAFYPYQILATKQDCFSELRRLHFRDSREEAAGDKNWFKHKPFCEILFK